MCMKCIVVDDDEISRRVIEEYVNRTDFITLEKSFDNAVGAINYLQQGNEVDLILLDIEMPDMTGIEFLNSLAAPPIVIIVSSKEKYALKAFEYSVADYLLKPFTYARFFKAVAKAMELFGKSLNPEQGQKEIFIKRSSSLIKINYEDILWIEALENYVVIVSSSDKHTIHFTMKSIESRMPSNQFKRIHRSYIVNVAHIYSIEDNSVLVKTADGKKILPIGKSYRDKLLREINLMNK